MGQVDGLRSNERVKERSSFVNTTNGDTIPYAVTNDARQQGIGEGERVRRTGKVMNE